jgi:transposase-like protein
MGAEAEAFCEASMASARRSGSTATATEAGLGHQGGSIELAVPKLREGSYFRTGC